MEPKDPKSSVATTFVEGTSIQAELLALLDKFVNLMTSDAMIDLQNLSEVCGNMFNQSSRGT
jgi:predicted ATP-grasp superfamily ATP-dependent carboligase